MPVPSSGMPLLAEIAAGAVREHGADWQKVRRAIEEALSDLPEAARRALDAEIVANDGLAVSAANKLGH